MLDVFLGLDISTVFRECVVPRELQLISLLQFPCLLLQLYGALLILLTALDYQNAEQKQRRQVEEQLKPWLDALNAPSLFFAVTHSAAPSPDIHTFVDLFYPNARIFSIS